MTIPGVPDADTARSTSPGEAIWKSAVASLFVGLESTVVEPTSAITETVVPDAPVTLKTTGKLTEAPTASVELVQRILLPAGAPEAGRKQVQPGGMAREPKVVPAGTFSENCGLVTTAGP